MKAQFTKRLLALVLAFAMVAVMLPAGMLNVFAEDAVTLWDFRTDDYTGQSPFNGLKTTGSFKKHGATYGMSIGNGTVSIPVSGNCEVLVSVGYNWDVTFPDGTRYSDNTNSGDITLSYVHTGGAGNVELKIGSEFTSYIKSIELTPIVEPATSWDFRGDDYTGQSPFNGLKTTGSFKKHGATYGMSINGGTVSIPVSGDCEVLVSVGYNWDVTFPDGTRYSDNTNSGDITLSYVHTGGAGNVELKIGSEFTSYIKSIELVAKDVSGAPKLDTTKVYVWDFGAEALDESKYVNMLNAEAINSWFAGVEAGTTGVNLASFETADGLLMFSDGGYPTTHRLRSVNTALTRYDDKSLKDADGNVYSGYIYSNKSSDTGVYVGIKVNAGEKVTLAVGSNGGNSLINFESPTGKITTGEFLSGGAKVQLLTFYPTESGMYKIYSSTEKLVLARIYREANNEVAVSGSVTAPEGLSDYNVVFTNTLSGASYSAPVRNGSYTVTLLDGYTYEMSLENANGYVINGNSTLAIDKPVTEATADITVVQVDLVTVTGSITGLSDKALEKIGVEFRADSIYVPVITVSGGTYTAVLEKGVAYELVITGVNDYELTGVATVCYEADTAADIAMAAKPVYGITIAPSGATLADLANATFTFTNLHEEGYVYTFTGTDAIALRDGVYTVKVTNAGAFVQQLTSNLKVNGAAVTKTVKFSSDISAWNFSDKDFTGTGGGYQGLLWTNAQKNKVYLLANTGTISVPVSGNCKIVVNACYQYSFYFASESEASVDQKTGSTGQIDSFTYTYTGGAGYVDITVLGTSYITSIEVLEPVEYAETVTVGASGCDYTTIGAALAAIKKMDRPKNERVTILIQPGNYEEMLVIDVPNVTLKNASSNPSIGLTNQGVGIDKNAVRITWYYGHGYTYYSMGSDCKFHADILEVNRENGYASFTNPGAGTTNGSYWNSTVVITASGFQASGIIFENSFNQYISEAAAKDVIEAQGGAKEGAVARADMSAGSVLVQDKAYVERAGALAIANNCKEIYFENCKFIGRQDTLYGGTGTTAAFYDCAIYGSTDYIYGGMTAVFAKCDLVFNTSENNNDVGYITAAQQSSGRGYLFYNCTVTSTTPGVDTASAYASKPGYFGRPWTANTGEAVFYKTVIEATCSHWYSIGASLIRADGWLSTLSGESALCGEYGTYEYALGVDNAGNRVSWAAVFETEYLADGTPITIEAFLGEWNAFAGKDLTVEIPTDKVNNDPDAAPVEPDDDKPGTEEPAPTVTEHHFSSLTDVTPGADKEAIAAGTTYADGFFTVIGTVTQRYSDSKGGVYAIEIGKNLTGALEFVVNGKGEVTLVVSSTGGSNTSVVAIVDAEGNVVGQIYSVSGTDTTTLTYSLEAGTYRIVSPENADLNRGFRLMSVDVVVTAETPENPETGDIFPLVVALAFVSAASIVILKKKEF